jgi:hypothetical protein
VGCPSSAITLRYAFLLGLLFDGCVPPLRECMCVCERERERESMRVRESVRERESCFESGNTLFGN